MIELIPKTKRLTADEIIELICQKLNVEIKHIKGKRRDAYIVDARHIIMYVLYSDRYLRLFLTQIGKMFNRHHSTIIHSVKFVKATMQVDSTYCEKIAEIFIELYGNTEYLIQSSDFVEKQIKIKSIANQFI